MRSNCFRFRMAGWLAVLLFGFFPGCGRNGDSSLENKDPGINDLNVIVAFGDSITQGSECNCVPYPARLAGLTGKTVHNEGVGGSEAIANVGRLGTVIAQHHPAYVFILYGINDVIHGQNINNILGALNQMVAICKQNNVVPVLATYPIPLAGHRVFFANTAALNEGIRNLAEAEGIECANLEREYMLEDASDDFGWVVSDPALYMPDGLHPNDAGTQVIAMTFADLF